MSKPVALITGGSRGIGERIVLQFENAGYSVISPSRKELDLSSRLSVANYINSFQGEVSVLVNNAGINILGSVENYNDADLDKMLETNLMSAFSLCRFVAGFQSLTAICNIASVWSERSYSSRGVYSMTKSALLGLTRGLAHDLGGREVMVNSVSPGFIETEMTFKNVSQQRREELCKGIPLGRFGATDSVANVVEFLCSSKNSYITGQNIVVDGGFLS